VATSSSLVLQIAFADGVVRDFSKDRRVIYGLAPGSTMCEVVKGEGRIGAVDGRPSDSGQRPPNLLEYTSDRTSCPPGQQACQRWALARSVHLPQPLVG
jgi:hypothetical protein